MNGSKMATAQNAKKRTNKQRITLNLLSFDYPVNTKEISFSIEKKKGFHTLKNANFPKQLLKEFPALKDKEELYTNYQLADDCDYDVEIDLSKESSFAIQFYRIIILEFFVKIANVAQLNFTNNVEVWFKNADNTTKQYTEFDRFTITLKQSKKDNKMLLFLSYDGYTWVYNKSLAVHPIKPSLLSKSKIIYNKKCFRYDNLKPYQLNELDKIYLKLNNHSIKYLNIQKPEIIKESPYLKKYRKIDQFKKMYLDVPEFSANMPVCKNFKVYPIEAIKEMNLKNSELVYANGNTGNNPYFDFPKYGPYKPPITNNLKFIFIYAKEHKSYAQKLKSFITKGDFPKSNKYGDIPKLSFFLKQEIELAPEFDVVFDNMNTAVAQTENHLREMDFEDSQIFAFYISPVTKLDEEYKHVYSDMKKTLLKRKIDSQTVYYKKINSSIFDLHLLNISSAMVAKLGGTPWKLKAETNKSLIIGCLGIYRSKQHQCDYVGNAFCFDNEGQFKGFGCFPSKDINSLIASIKKAVGQFYKENDKIESITIHFYKRISKKEIAPIEKMLQDLKIADIPVYIVTINQSKEKSVIGFDLSNKDKIPINGTAFPVDKDQFLLYSNTRNYEEKSVIGKSYPLPIKLSIAVANGELNREINEQLISQVFQLNKVYFRSTKMQSMPATIIYSIIYAEMYANFDGDLPDFAKKSLSFL